MSPDPVQWREDQELRFWLGRWRDVVNVWAQPHSKPEQGWSIKEPGNSYHVQRVYVLGAFEPVDMGSPVRDSSEYPIVTIRKIGTTQDKFLCIVCGSRADCAYSRQNPAYVKQWKHRHNFACARDAALRSLNIKYSEANQKLEASLWEASAASDDALEILHDHFLELGIMSDPTARMIEEARQLRARYGEDA